MGFLVQNRSIPPESLNPLLRRCSSVKASRSHPMDEQALWFQTSLDSSQKLNSSVLEGSRQFLNSFKLSFFLHDSTLGRPIFVSQEGKVLWVREGRFNWCVTERQEQVVSFVFLFWLRLSPHRKKKFSFGHCFKDFKEYFWMCHWLLFPDSLTANIKQLKLSRVPLPWLAAPVGPCARQVRGQLTIWGKDGPGLPGISGFQRKVNFGQLTLALMQLFWLLIISWNLRCRDSKAVKVEDSSIRIECDCHPWFIIAMIHDPWLPFIIVIHVPWMTV